MTSTPALTAFAADRFSPLRFDPARTVTEAEVDVLLRAAGRAPSAGNSQPWSFIAGRRGDAVHTRLTRHLARSSAAWAPDASLLLADLAQLRVEGGDFEYSEFAHYDLGQAVAHLTFQAHAMGLAVHQFRAFDREAVEREFAVPAHWEVTSMAAIGVPAPEAAGMAGPGTTRDRHPLDRITWARQASGHAAVG